jgi:hypothetical protein
MTDKQPDKGRYDWDEGDIVWYTQRRAWDESAHPREPAGSPEGGQFAGGAGGTGAAGGSVKFEDFARDDVKLDDTAADNEEFLKRWNEEIGMAPGEFKKQFLGGLKGTMVIKFYPIADKLRFAGALLDEQGVMIGDYERHIDLDDKYAESNHFKLSKTGADVGKQLLAANVKIYQQLGIKNVRVFANLEVGGYAWARYGYVPDEGELGSVGVLSEQIADRINEMEIDADHEKMLYALINRDDPRAIWAIADSKYGKELLLGTEWEGRLDLTNKDTMARFNAYVGKK